MQLHPFAGCLQSAGREGEGWEMDRGGRVDGGRMGRDGRGKGGGRGVWCSFTDCVRAAL